MRKVVSLLLFFYAATMIAQNEIHYFKGKLNGKTAFELVYGYQQAGENDHGRSSSMMMIMVFSAG